MKRRLTPQQIENILSSETLKDKTLSLGFRRLAVLPEGIEAGIDTYIYLTEGTTDNHKAKVRFFEEMTEAEFLNYLKTL